MTQTSTGTRILRLQDLSLSIGERLLFKQLSLELQAGQCLGILGQNGTGKTTLLHTLMRLRPAPQGRIELCERALEDWPRETLATHLGILFQNHHDVMPATVLEIALMGRHPHLANWQWESREDIAIARDALQALGIASLEKRDVNSLSGGERQRLAIATVLTQRPRLFLLDEPGNHLDIAFQVQSLQLLRAHVQSHQAALCMATHDINLAAAYCDRILLLTGSGEVMVGTAEQVLSCENLSRAYGCDIRRVVVEDGRAVFYPA
ncbi:MAG: ABC transporter ATP-binding protein [Pseudomonadales bacterium]|nr:ABC transporter ATP-binding protein [Pseudomonadales bacterium]